MNTPVCDFLDEYQKKESLRLHMPGHKGMGEVETFDITEIEGADVLYSPKGIIRESENNAARLFGTARTVYSAEGSSLSIRAMLYLAMLWGKEQGKGSTVLAARNAHKTFISGAALLDLDVEWIYGEGSTLCECEVGAAELDAKLEKMHRAGKSPFAVYLTSPDYLGNILDIRALSEVCRKYGVLCLVDNAHGAYLAFFENSMHPIALGAHMCADSAHKTLPVLTGGSYLHLSLGLPEWTYARADDAMALFASTSPSYLILRSLDLANRYISEGYAEKLKVFSQKLGTLKSELVSKGYVLKGREALKLTVCAKEYGYYGAEIGKLLEENGIVCEFCDRDHVVMMLTPEIAESELDRLKNILLSIPKRDRIDEAVPALPYPKREMSVREAVMSISEELDTDLCAGRVLATATVSCPPAVPVVSCGELIDETAIIAMKYYGIEKCSVVKI